MPLPPRCPIFEGSMSLHMRLDMAHDVLFLPELNFYTAKRPYATLNTISGATPFPRPKRKKKDKS
jgi:hypothetical protein